MPGDLIPSLKSDLSCVDCRHRLLLADFTVHISDHLESTSQQNDYMARIVAGQLPNPGTAFF